jgi:hypothetical protein
LAGETEVLGENEPHAMSTTNPTCPDVGSNPGRRGGKPATNRLSYGTATATANWAVVVCRIAETSSRRLKKLTSLSSTSSPQAMNQGRPGEDPVSLAASSFRYVTAIIPRDERRNKIHRVWNNQEIKLSTLRHLCPSRPRSAYRAVPHTDTPLLLETHTVIFCDMTPCSLESGDQHFVGPYCHHLQGTSSRHATLLPEYTASCPKRTYMITLPK